MADPVRFASVGLGWWGKVLARSAVESGAGEPVACFARSPEARAAFAAEFGCREASLEEILADGGVEAVLVVTPHTAHAAIMLAAFEAGKHVFVEKPLTVSVDDAERCVAAAEQAGLVLQVGHHRRRLTANRRIKAMIDAGELGVVQQVEANHSAPALFSWPEGSWRRRRAESPAGGMTALGCHQLDTMQYLLGPPRRVSAFSKRVLATSEVDDATAMLIEFERGPLGYLGTSPAIPRRVELTVYGTDAAVRSDGDGARLSLQRRDEGDWQELEVEQNDPVAEQLLEFARCVREGGVPETGGPEGLAVVRMIEAAVRSAEEGRAVELEGA